MRTLRHNTLHWFPACAFIALYLLFDWATYIDPLHGLNITPWNPDPALGMVFWLRYGKRAALPWFVALLAGEVLVRGVSAGLIITLLGALWLTLAYGVIGEALRRRFSSTDIFDNSHRLFAWVAIVVAGSVVNGVVYVTLLTAAELDAGQRAGPRAAARACQQLGDAGLSGAGHRRAVAGVRLHHQR